MVRLLVRELQVGQLVTAEGMPEVFTVIERVGYHLYTFQYIDFPSGVVRTTRWNTDLPPELSLYIDVVKPIEDGQITRG